MGERWNAWRALRDRAHVRLRWGSPNGHDGQVDTTGTIWLHPHLGRQERHAVLAHELVHLERGIPAPATPAVLVAREERLVDAEVARRLVPLDELARFAVARVTVEPVTARLVADEFDVPVAVAERALAQLRHPRSAAVRAAAGLP